MRWLDAEAATRFGSRPVPAVTRGRRHGTRTLRRIARQRRHGGDRGFTLIDTLVGLGLLVLVTATIGQFLFQQIRAGSTNAAATRAYTLAAEQLEDMRAFDYKDLASRSSSVQEGALSYTIDTTVLPDTPALSMKQIIVNVAWNDPRGPQNVKVQSIFTAVRR